MEFPGVFISQAVSLLLALIVILTFARLVVREILNNRLPRTARRVVLLPVRVPVTSFFAPKLSSALLPVSISTRAPPTFRSDRTDNCCMPGA